MDWYLCKSLVRFRAQVNTAFPGRDKGSDGTIGDARHQAESNSGHNPDSRGAVRAFDVDSDLDPDDPAAADRLAEDVRILGKAGFRPLAGGYVIWDRRIASADHQPAWEWHAYTRADPHTGHVHISVSNEPDLYDLDFPWPLALTDKETDDMADPDVLKALESIDASLKVLVKQELSQDQAGRKENDGNLDSVRELLTEQNGLLRQILTKP